MKMERMSSSVQSWVDQHKLATIGGVWAAAVGASVAYSRRRTPQRATSLRLTLAVLGGAALAHHYYNSKNSEADLDHDFYSQLPSATDADGNENERWSWWWSSRMRLVYFLNHRRNPWRNTVCPGRKRREKRRDGRGGTSSL